MSFEKYEWQKGETITADKLNHMEDGIANASQGGGGSEPLIVAFDHKETDGDIKYIFDKTWQEVADALGSNRAVYIKPYFVDEDEVGIAELSMCPVLTAHNGVGKLLFTVYSIYSGINSSGMNPIVLRADSANGLLYNETGNIE